MNLLDPIRTWWQRQTGEEETPLDGDTPAWIISMFVHLGLFVLLVLFTFAPPREEPDLVLSTVQPEEEEDLIPEEFYFSELPQEKIGANSLQAEDVALAEAPIESEISEVPVPELESEVGPMVIDSNVTFASAPNVGDLVVRGAQGVGTTGAMGAIDRITHEILLSLDQRQTMVVWIFDKSGSLQRQRQGVLDRFDRIYEELGVIEASGNKAFAKHEDTPLLTAVMAFGEDVEMLTPKPTADIAEIKTAVGAIQNDPSGIERTFTAIHMAADRFKSYRVQEPRRNVMLIVFTDEAGDDYSGLDPTVRICRNYQMPVYVVGVPAPFGRQEVDIKYVDPNPENNQSPQWIPVRQGPESFMPERVKLHFAGANGRDMPIDSGFGPYTLTRLCFETGGIYFSVHPNRDSRREVRQGETPELSAHIARFFDQSVMRRYRPDYVPTEKYNQLLKQNKARGALVQASMLSWAAPMESPRLTFPKEDEGQLAGLLTEAQKDAAVLEPQVQRLAETLAMGESDRPKLSELRWQAGYDLAMGRTLAVMVRTQAYNAMLAKAKNGMKFKNPQNDTWELVPADEITVGSVLEKQGAKARMYLERTVKEHPGTPWAYLAAEELKTPLGWRWDEKFTGVQARIAGMGNGNANPRNDRRNNMAKPKPVVKPKL